VSRKTPLTMRSLCVLAISIMVIGLLSGCGTGNQSTPQEGEEPGTVEVIKIGVILPLSGSCAPVGVHFREGFEFAAKEINDAGGIQSLGGAKLQLVFGDSASKPDVGMSEAERLITKDKVHVLTGCYQSSVTYAATEVAERYQVPFLVAGSVKDDITERGFKYTFRPNQKAVYDATLDIEFIEGMAEKTGIKPRTVAISYENSDWGQSHTANLRQLVPAHGMTVVMDEEHAADAPDLTSTVLKIKDAKADVIKVTGYTSDEMLIARGLYENKVDSMGVIGGLADPILLEEAPEFFAYWFFEVEWDDGILEARPWAKPINERFKAAYGRSFDTSAAQGFSDTYILADVFERAASTDPEAVREALAATEITSGPAMIMPYEKIVFDSEGQNPYARCCIVQVLDNEFKVVFPFHVAEVEAVWPVPAFSQR